MSLNVLKILYLVLFDSFIELSVNSVNCMIPVDPLCDAAHFPDLTNGQE